MIRSYFNRKAATWDKTVAEKDTAKLRSMAERLHLQPGFTVLDVGTGTGVFLPYILEKIGGKSRIAALDVANEMLLRAKAKDFNSNICYLCADIMDIPLSDTIFDAVVCYSSFPHFRDKPKAFAEMYRVLKKGGRLSICHTSSREKINEIHHSIEVVQHDTIPEKDEMLAMLKQAGFTEIQIEDGSESYLASAVKR